MRRGDSSPEHHRAHHMRIRSTPTPGMLLDGPRNGEPSDVNTRASEPRREAAVFLAFNTVLRRVLTLQGRHRNSRRDWTVKARTGSSIPRSSAGASGRSSHASTGSSAAAASVTTTSPGAPAFTRRESRLTSGPK